MFHKTTVFLSTLLVLGGVLFFSEQAHAEPDYAQIRDEGFSARYISQSLADPVKIEAGKTVEVMFTFKNVGTKTWDGSSQHFISAYTMNPRYRASDFQASNWLEYRQTAKISGVVKPGQTGTLSLQLKAPEKQGHYKEEFWLASDGWSWVKGGYFYVEIDVVAPTPDEVVDDSTDEVDDVVADETQEELTYKAKKLLLNKKTIEAKGGEQIQIILGFQNLGTATWTEYAVIANEPVTLASTGERLTFADGSWQSYTKVLEQDKEVPQWKTTRDEFVVRTPVKQGEYELQFKLAVDGDEVDDVVVTIPVTVTQDAPSHYTAPIFALAPEDTPRLSEEPRIRVGVWKNPEDSVEFISHDDTYIIYAGDTRKGVLQKDDIATLMYENGMYAFESNEVNFSSEQFIRLVPEHNPHAVFELKNYERYVTWKGNNNFNLYRGAAELRLTEDKKSVYLINDLLFEDYIAGIAETSNVSDIEYIRALLTAARTYAYYIKEYSTKHDSRYFDVVASTGDQLYLGYESEQLMPRVAQAARDTSGYMVTYKHDVVITPYFGNSDGRTRSWTEVWGGSDKPWLVSVTAKYDKRDGKSLYGHGVGMSARDAAYMAEEEDVDWKDILKYYYTGIEVERIY